SQYNVTIENTGEENAIIEYTWVPTSDKTLIEKYFAALPEEERPISGTAGALDRRQKLQYQVKSFLKIIDYCFSSLRIFIYSSKHCTMKIGEVGIVTDHGKKSEIWHPNCFRCHTCQQRLVDMLYFYKDGDYYCGRHYGDTMYPRCAGCDELIFSKEYTFAESKNWHFDHFCCFGCDKQLGGHRYMVRDDQPYCFDCYMTKFAKCCQTCHGKIAPDQQRISYKELHWHASGRCFQLGVYFSIGTERVLKIHLFDPKSEGRII
ncbi:unnamed protein product, partial [Enterobius vermicularis]|uniref:LIM zinc-binding domain-containing protein n=1 Tax=Enterobius vermicularis TaxID=51028 RepID=A0A0N4UVC8_ENTVE